MIGLLITVMAATPAIHWTTIAIPVMAIMTAVAAGWGITRSGAVNAWKDAALGYKEQVADLSGRLERAEEALVDANSRISKLEAYPDMTEVIKAVEQWGERIVRAVEGR